MEENHDRDQAVSGMPHLASWATTYGQATNYSAVSSPSLPNYLAIFGGSTFGVRDDNDPSAHPLSGASVFGQTLASGGTAKAYAEDMPSNCYPTDSGNYAVRHGGWAYFVDERSPCNAFNVPMGTPSSGNLRNDINAGTLPTTGEMTPNECNDAHDCSLNTADAWLNGWIPALMAGPDYTSGNLTIIITFDEGDRTSNVAFVVIDPRLSGKTVTLTADHYALTRWLDENAGAALLRSAATAANLKAGFGL